MQEKWRQRKEIKKIERKDGEGGRQGSFVGMNKREEGKREEGREGKRKGGNRRKKQVQRQKEPKEFRPTPMRLKRSEIDLSSLWKRRRRENGRSQIRSTTSSYTQIIPQVFSSSLPFLYASSSLHSTYLLQTLTDEQFPVQVSS